MTWDFFFRLLVAGVLGALVGIDREYRAKEAGFRTHFLVALGSALFMIVSKYGFEDILGKEGVGLDPSRIASQVVTGIGFLGAGTIIIQKLFVRGLTTAAGIWTTAAVGLAGAVCLRRTPEYSAPRSRTRTSRGYTPTDSRALQTISSALQTAP